MGLQCKRTFSKFSFKILTCFLILWFSVFDQSFTIYLERDLFALDDDFLRVPLVILGCRLDNIHAFAVEQFDKIDNRAIERNQFFRCLLPLDVTPRQQASFNPLTESLVLAVCLLFLALLEDFFDLFASFIWILLDHFHVRFL